MPLKLLIENGWLLRISWPEKQSLSVNSSATFLQHFLWGYNQICWELLQMLVGRLGLEPRATWLKVPRCGQLRNSKDSIISYLNDQYFPGSTLVFLCFFLWVERNWNERYLHQPPTDAPHPASFRKRDNHENKNVTFLCQINRGMKTKRVLLKFIYVILKLICKKFCHCQPDKDILTSSNYPQILKEARMD
jgi:hypothetical protein